ncbi:hypothetical protein ACN469_40800 [Corallococcus terminator]
MNPLMNQLMKKAVLCSLMAVGAGALTVTGCDDGARSERAPSGEDVLVIPVGARLVPDAENQRVLVMSSSGEREYALGKEISCENAQPVLSHGRITCDASRMSQTHVYFKLDGKASEVSDADLLRAPMVTVSRIEGPSSVSCGVPPSGFDSLLERFTSDMAQEVSNAGSTERVLVRHVGAWALVPVPVGLLPRTGPDARIAAQVSAYEYGGESVTCSCTQGSSCPKKSQWVPIKGTIYWCDASNCQSCSMSF